MTNLVLAAEQLGFTVTEVDGVLMHTVGPDLVPLVGPDLAAIVALADTIVPEQSPVSLQQFAGARLNVDQDIWDVTGLERSTGISGAMLIDTDTVWVFWKEPQPNTDYVIIPSDGVTKYEEYVEVMRPGLTELNFIGQRVQ